MVVKIPVFDVSFRVYTDRELVMRVLAKEGIAVKDEKRLEYSDGFVVDDIMYIEKLEMRVVLHECSHMVDNILYSLGIDDKEVRAYLIAYVYGKVKGGLHADI